MCFESVGRISKLLDQFIYGLGSLGFLQVVRAFPDLFTPIFVYTASVSSSEVIESIYIDEEVTNVLPGDTVVMAHLKCWLNEGSESGKNVF